MIVSRPFAVGIGLLVVVDLIAPRLPAPVEAWALLASALLLPLPAALARYSGQRVLQRTLRGQPLGAGLRIAAAGQRIAVPVVFGLLITWGGLLDLADLLAPETEWLHTAVVITPLVAMDLSVRMIELHVARWLESHGFGPRTSLIRSRARTTVLVSGCLLLIAAAADLLAITSRSLDLWLTHTDAGLTLCLLLAFATLPVLLPPALLFALPTDRRLPPEWVTPVQHICRQLDFPYRSVRLLLESRQLITAALVGYLPRARFLLLTDGILTALDPFALRGVIAHEVAHLRGRHIQIKLLALALLPLLLVQPLATLDPGALTPETWLAVLAVGGATAWLAMRQLLLRVEYEADLGSAELLGHAEPTIAALQRISDILPGRGSWLPSFHPSESDRIALLNRWERDPDFRRGFARRSRILRHTLLAITVAALGWNLSLQIDNWSIDRARLAFLRGNFADAAERIATLRDGDDPHVASDLQTLDDLTEAAIELVGAGGAWLDLRGDLAARAWPRALQALDQDGPAAAYRYAALAVVTPSASPLQRCVERLCAAAADQDRYAMRRVADHLDRWTKLPLPVRQVTDRVLAGMGPTVKGAAAKNQ